jgi:enoyl-CoA hydratase
MAESLVVRDHGAVRWVLFNRPGVRNAQDWPMLKSLIAVLDDTRHDPTVRALVLGGEGDAFSSGHDLKQPSRNPEWAAATATAEDRYRTELRYFVEPVEILRRMPIPTICRVQGACMAAGLMFTGATDLVVASDDARFGTTVLSGGGIVDSEIATFAGQLPARKAKQLLWLGETITAQEALQLGYVNWVVPREQLDDKINEILAKLTAIPPITLELSKTAFQFLADRRGDTDFQRFHYVTHQLSHHTSDGIRAQRLRDERVARGEPLAEPPSPPSRP